MLAITLFIVLVLSLLPVIVKFVAISQLEKYIHYASDDRTKLESLIKKEKGLEVAIIKPKGILVIGQRNQLKNKKMIDDLAVLRSSLKNIEVVLYDEMFESLNNLKRVTNKTNNDKQELQ